MKMVLFSSKGIICSFDANDAKKANEAKNEAKNNGNTDVQKMLEEQIIDLIGNNNSISKCETANKRGKSKAAI